MAYEGGSAVRRYLLFVTMLFLLVGCGGQGASTPDSEVAQMVVEEVSATESAQAPTATLAPTHSPVPTGAPVPAGGLTPAPEQASTATSTPEQPSTASATVEQAGMATPTPRPTSTASATPMATSTPLPTASPETRVTQVSTAAPTVDLIVDNQGANFSTEGWWYTGDGGQSYGRDCAWAPRGVQNIAKVDPGLPEVGTYEIFAWWCGDPNHDQSRRAPIQIHPTAGQSISYQVHVNLQDAAGQWNSIGVYVLERDAFLTVNGNLEGNVVADAFRFRYLSADPVIITPTPLPTAFPWTGNPPSPLEQVTSGDLSMRLGLVQRFYPYTPIKTTEAGTFDDCQAFPRNGCGGTREGWRVQVEYQDMVVPYRVSGDYHHVAIEASPALVERQVLYLFGVKGDRFFRVDRYPDDTWHLSGADFEGTYAGHQMLDAGAVAALRPLVQTYSSDSFRTLEGLDLTLYGLGEVVALSDEDRSRLAILGKELVDEIWW